MLIISTVKELEKLKSFQEFSFYCVQCGKLHTIHSFRKNMIDNYKEFLCSDCLKLKRYGCISPFQREDVKNNIKHHNLEKFGVEYPLQSQEVHNTISENNLKKFGNKSTLHDGGECEAKATKTFNNKYGVDHPLQNKEIYEKTRDSFKSKTGHRYSFEDEETYNKAISTIEETYGVDNIMKLYESKSNMSKMNREHPEWHESSLENNRKNHNGLLNSQTDEFRQFMSKHMSNLWNITDLKQQMRVLNLEHPEWHESSLENNRKNHNGLLNSQTDEFKTNLREQRLLHPEKFQSKHILYNDVSFDSIPEFCVYLYCIYHWIPIIRNDSIYFDYTDIKGKHRQAFPDFIINNQLIEIKGTHFFKPDGSMYLPYRNPKWSDEEYEYRSSIYESKRKCLIYNRVIILKDTDPWIQNCIDWVYSIVNIDNFLKSNTNNLCCGYTPYICDQSKEFQDPIGIGNTPFDL